MRMEPWKYGSVLAVVAAVLLPLHDTDSVSESLARWQRDEIAHVRRHLEGAERVLLGADTRDLSPRQREARARNIAILHAYRQRGVFPRNLDFPSQRVPYFVDDRGVPCAMAYLIACSGRRDIVDRVRTTRNNARIRELANDRDLIAWLDQSGMTVAEAARIQPDYGPAPEPESVTPGYAMATAAASFANGATIVWNLKSDRHGAAQRRQGVLTMAIGVCSVGLGAAKFDDQSGAQGLGIWNAALGLVSIVTGAQAVHQGNRDIASNAETAAARGRAVLAVGPVLESPLGLRLTLSF
jgi:hypothetical protein